MYSKTLTTKSLSLFFFSVWPAFRDSFRFDHRLFFEIKITKYGEKKSENEKDPMIHSCGSRVRRNRPRVGRTVTEGPKKSVYSRQGSSRPAHPRRHIYVHGKVRKRGAGTRVLLAGPSLLVTRSSPGTLGRRCFERVFSCEVVTLVPAAV